MSFTLLIVVLLLATSYAFIYKGEKSKFKITSEERKVYSKFIYLATLLFIIAVVTSFYTTSKLVDLSLFLSLIITLIADFYVWKRFTNDKQITTNVSCKV